MLKTLIIDDDKSCADALEQMLLERHIKVDAIARDGNEGIRYIQKYKPNVVFLDVEMPRMSGFDLLETLSQIDFHIIFVTCYDKYALRAIQFSALDYLLKPVNAELLDKALNKVQNRPPTPDRKMQYKTFIENHKTNDPSQQIIALPTLEGLIFIPVNDIVRCDASGSYTSVALINKTSILVSRILKDFEIMLEGKNFFRVHNSHLINLNHIKKYTRGEGGHVIMCDDVIVEIARSRKEEFLNLFMKP